MLGDRLAQRFVVAAALAVADEGGAGDGGHVLHTHEDAKGDGACPPPRGPVGRLGAQARNGGGCSRFSSSSACSSSCSAAARKLGRASCRERVGQCRSISGAAVSLTKQKKTKK